MTRLPSKRRPMVRSGAWPVASLSLALLGAVELAQAQEKEKPPEFPSAIELVTVDVVVKDGKGNPVPGLGLADFTLLEDGRPQTITSFDQVSGSESAALSSPEGQDPLDGQAPSVDADLASRLRRTFVIVFDQVHLTSLQADRGRRALSSFLGALRDGERVRLVAVDGWETFGPTQEVIEELPRLEGLWAPQQGPEALTEYEAMRIERYDDGPLMLRVMERIAILTTGYRPRAWEGERIRNTTAKELGLSLDEGYIKALAKPVYHDAVKRNETTLDALETVLDNLTSVRGRKSVILVSSALLQDPSLPGFRRVTDASNRANAALYFIDARGLEGMPGENAEFGTMLPSIDQGIALASQSLQAAGAEGLAADTGGFTVKNRNDLASGFRQIAAEARSYYLLGYSPAPARADGEFRKIQVKVARKGALVRARKGYFANLPGTDREDPTSGWGTRSVRGEDADIPLRTASYFFGDAGAGKLHTLIAAEADIRGLALENRGGLLRGSLDLVIVVTPMGGGEPDRFVQQVDVSLTAERRKTLEARGLPLARAIDLVPGEYEARIALSDRKGGRVGAASLRFEVPAETFRVSTPILSDFMEPGADAAKDAPAIGARRRFRQRGTLYFQYEVYGAKADPSTGGLSVVSGWTIRDRAGTEWAGAEPSRLEAAGRPSPGRLGQVSLTFPPGEYILVLEARDQLGERRVEVHEPFTVEAARP